MGAGLIDLDGVDEGVLQIYCGGLEFELYVAACPFREVDEEAVPALLGTVVGHDDCLDAFYLFSRSNYENFEFVLIGCAE